jgi:hypothetical protein
MKNIIFLILIIIIANACSSDIKMSGSQSQKAYIKLFVHPKQGFKPLTVVMEAELINYQNEENKFYCLLEEWDFGDGNKSYYQPDCKEGDKIKTKYIATHTYYNPGTYRIQLTLGKNVIRSQSARVNVYSSGI